MKEIIAKESTLSEMFGVSERQIRNICIDHKVSPGKYNLKKSVKKYIENLKDLGKDETAGLRRADKELKEFKLGIMKKEYIPVDQVVLAVTDMQMRAKSKAMSIANNASLEVLGKTNRKEIEIIIQKYVNEFLEEMSQFQMEDNENV